MRPAGWPPRPFPRHRTIAGTTRHSCAHHPLGTAGKKRPGPQHARAHFPKKQYASSVPARGALDVAAHTPWPHNLFCYVTGSPALTRQARDFLDEVPVSTVLATPRVGSLRVVTRNVYALASTSSRRPRRRRFCPTWRQRTGSLCCDALSGGGHGRCLPKVGRFLMHRPPLPRPSIGLSACRLKLSSAAGTYRCCR